MTQNRSSAVMAQRAEPHDSLDFFPTPPWATRALCEYLKRAYNLRTQSVWEPACGQGHMARPLGEFFGEVYASDVHPYGFGETHDFLMPYMPRARDGRGQFDWIITNPPFRLGMEFALTAIRRARIGTALLVRTAFLEGGERHRDLFLPNPPNAIHQFCERVPMVKGRYDPDASSATSYCWIVWNQPGRHEMGTHFHWIPPCRTRHQRSCDTTPMEAP